MYMSRFNYVGDYKKEQQRLLINFLSRSADIIDSDSADYFLSRIEDGKITDEERDYLLERGYIFSNKDQESQILKELYENELKISAPIYLMHLGTFSIEKLNIHEILKKINEMERKRNEKIRPDLILYNENSLVQSQIIKEIEEFIKDCNSLNMNTKLITTPQTLSFFESIFTKGFVEDITLICSISEFGNSFSFPDKIERFLDQLIECKKNITIDVRLTQEDVKNLKSIMNYFIYKGWPFLENFESRLEPADNISCIFGYWYSFNMELPREIFEIFRTYPQTEFFSMEKWIGINNINALIWKGRLPSPSFHFCNASKGLIVFTGDGNILPCLKLAENTNEAFRGNKSKFKKFKQRNGMRLPDCQGCKYILSCGGGCSYENFKQTKGKASCPPVRDLIEVSLETYFSELLERIKFLEQNIRGIYS